MINPNDTGPQVAALHQALQERGLLPPDAVNEVKWNAYGPITQGAVQTFQVKHALAPDRIVGPRTWSMLTTAVDAQGAVPDPDYAKMGEIAKRALAQADAEFYAGVTEHPMGTNRGQRVDEYQIGVRMDGTRYLRWARDPRVSDGWGGAPWCGRFAKFCIDSAAAQLARPSPLDGWGPLAAATQWRDAAAARGLLFDDAKPGRVGIIIVPPAAAGADPHGHLLLVAAADNGFTWTREGNSGNRVAARRRAASECIGFVQIG